MMNLAKEAERDLEDPSLVDSGTGLPYKWRLAIGPDTKLKGTVGALIFEILKSREQTEAEKAAGMPPKPEPDQSAIAEIMADESRLKEIEGLRDRLACAGLVAVFDSGKWIPCRIVEVRDHAVELVDGQFVQKRLADGTILVWLGWFSDQFLWEVFSACVEKMVSQLRSSL